MFIFIKKTLADLEIHNARVIKMDVFHFIDQCSEKFDLIFAGPPYALQNIDDLPLLIFEKKLVNPAGWFILEHTPRNDYRNIPTYRAERKYGTTIFSIFINNNGSG
jgi:16S rRNA G966 N2-methylase RsmD